MLRLSNILAVAVAAQAVFATPIKVRTDYAVKEVHPAPRKWVSAGRAPSDHKLHLQIGLKQENFDELERHLYEGMPTKAPQNLPSLIPNSLGSRTRSVWPAFSHRGRT